MEEILASVNGFSFDIERDLEEQVGALPLPFPGMDKSGAATCVFHLKGSCSRGAQCPYRHIKPDRTVVCKHWLRGLCKKGDQCEFLHEYDMSKMPECYFYSRFHACSNKECPFLHIDPESKIKDCPWYDRGFCRHGPNCRHRHTRRVACLNYICGFCPDGPNCKNVHPRFDLPQLDAAIQSKKGTVVCHYCNEVGHKIYNCQKMPPEEREEAIQNKLMQLEQQHQTQLAAGVISGQNNVNNNANTNNIRPDFNQHPRPPYVPRHHMHPRAPFPGQQPRHPSFNSTQSIRNISDPRSATPGSGNGDPRQPYRPLDQVTCFKCGEKGHYANKCPKGHLAFLSSALQELQSSKHSE